MNIKNIVFTLGAVLILCLVFNSVLFADIYQWTDADGSEHISDTPPSVKTLKKIKLRRTSESVSEPVSLKNEIKPETGFTNKAVENKKTDLNAEREIKSTWRAFRNAVSRGNAQEAANQFSTNTRSQQLSTFKAAGGKLPDLANELRDIEIRNVYDNNSAVAIMYRTEMVGGQMEKVDFSIDFIKENDGWKILYY